MIYDDIMLLHENFNCENKNLNRKAHNVLRRGLL